MRASELEAGAREHGCLLLTRELAELWAETMERDATEFSEAATRFRRGAECLRKELHQGALEQRDGSDGD